MRFYLLYIVLVFGILCGCHSTSNKQIVSASNKNLVLDNGVLFYNASPFNGILMSNYDSGTIKTKVEYVAGKKDGSEIQWYENGRKLSERFYTKGFKVGTHRSWWENNNLKFEYYFNEKGEYHGEMKEWYQSGQLLRAFNYLNGKELGSQRLWKPDGSIKANYEVVNGERFGLIGLKKCYTVTVDKDEIK